MQKKAYITNGQSFNDYFEEKFNMVGIPFNEALITGNLVLDVFSEEFFLARSIYHNCEIDEYKEYLKHFIKFTENVHTYKTVELWFGDDAFCQINMLTILVFLENTKYKGEVFFLQINENNFLEIPYRNKIILGEYSNIYKNVINKSLPKNFKNKNMSRAIDLYFDILNENGKLACMIKENLGMKQNELIKFIMLNTKEYGLGDLQIKHLVEKYQATQD